MSACRRDLLQARRTLLKSSSILLFGAINEEKAKHNSDNARNSFHRDSDFCFPSTFLLSIAIKLRFATYTKRLRVDVLS